MFRGYFQRGQKAAPSQFRISLVSEIDVGERANAQRFFARDLQQRDKAQVAISWTQRLQHDGLDLAPLAFDVCRRQHQQRLAGFGNPAFHLLDAWRARLEIAEVDEGSQSGAFEFLQQFFPDPLSVLAAVGDEHIPLECRRLLHCHRSQKPSQQVELAGRTATSSHAQRCSRTPAR